MTALVFSYAEGIWHPYYTTMLAPAIAAAGLVRFWRAYRDSGGVGWLLLPLAFTVTAVWAFVLASRDTSWHGWARWAVVVVTGMAVGGLVAGRLTPTRGQRRVVGRPSLVVGLVAVLLVPAVWSTATAATVQNGGIPAAGPADGFGGGMPSGSLPGMPNGTTPFPGMGFPGNGQPPAGNAQPPSGMGQPPTGMVGGPSGGAELTDDQRRILDYAEQHGDGATITLAINSSAMMVASYIIGSDSTVIGMGGFMGADNAPSVDQLAEWSAEGRLRFVLSGSGGGLMGQLTGQGVDYMQQRHKWVEQHCAMVDPSAYGGQSAQPEQGAGLMGAQTLYDCGS